MELKLYRQPIINFQGHSDRFSSHILFIFQVNLFIFQPRNFLLPPNNFQIFQLSTYLLITIIIWAFRPERNFIQTLLIQPKRYSLFEVATPFENSNSSWILLFPLKTSFRFVETLTSLTSHCPYFVSVAVLNNFLKSWRNKSILTET